MSHLGGEQGEHLDWALKGGVQRRHLSNTGAGEAEKFPGRRNSMCKGTEAIQRVWSVDIARVGGRGQDEAGGQEGASSGRSLNARWRTWGFFLRAMGARAGL